MNPICGNVGNITEIQGESSVRSWLSPTTIQYLISLDYFWKITMYHTFDNSTKCEISFSSGTYAVTFYFPYTNSQSYFWNSSQQGFWNKIQNKVNSIVTYVYSKDNRNKSHLTVNLWAPCCVKSTKSNTESLNSPVKSPPFDLPAHWIFWFSDVHPPLHIAKRQHSFL